MSAPAPWEAVAAEALPPPLDPAANTETSAEPTPVTAARPEKVARPVPAARPDPAVRSASAVRSAPAPETPAPQTSPPESTRRTVVIRGHGQGHYTASRRGYEARLKPHERTGFKPDRVALWAVLLGLALLLGAVTSSHAATLHPALLHHLLLRAGTP